MLSLAVLGQEKAFANSGTWATTPLYLQYMDKIGMACYKILKYMKTTVSVWEIQQWFLFFFM